MESYASMILGGSDRNAEQLGDFVAWLLSNHLLQPNLERDAARSVTRVRLQELSGADFMSLELHGELKPEHLSDEGRKFVEHYLVSGRYAEDYARLTYDGDNEWHRYAEIAPVITRAWRDLTAKQQSVTGKLARVLKFPSRKK